MLDVLRELWKGLLGVLREFWQTPVLKPALTNAAPAAPRVGFWAEIRHDMRDGIHDLGNGLLEVAIVLALPALVVLLGLLGNWLGGSVGALIGIGIGLVVLLAVVLVVVFSVGWGVKLAVSEVLRRGRRPGAGHSGQRVVIEGDVITGNDQPGTPVLRVTPPKLG